MAVLLPPNTKFNAGGYGSTSSTRSKLALPQVEIYATRLKEIVNENTSKEALPEDGRPLARIFFLLWQDTRMGLGSRLNRVLNCNSKEKTSQSDDKLG